MRLLLTGLLVGLLALASGCVTGGAEPSVLDFASGQNYTKLHVEVDYVEGHKPRDAAIDLLKTRIHERLSKPDGVTVELKSIASTRSTYSDADLGAMTKEHRNTHAEGRTLSLHVLYLNGHHDRDTGDSKVLGVQFGASAIAIFKQTVEESAGPLALFGAADVEKAVLIHEFGHAIGLVNHGLPMARDHEDDDHRGHSANRESVMYWAVETTLGLRTLTNAIPTDFDADDRADLKAAGGK